MKRKNEIDNMDDLKREKLHPDGMDPAHGIGGDHPAWPRQPGTLSLVDWTMQVR